MALVFQVTIAVILWGILWPFCVYGIADEDITEQDQDFIRIAFTFRSFFAHGFPAIMLTIDFFMNSIVFDWRHYIIQVLVGILYFIVNIAVHFGFCINAYPTSDWTVRPGIAIFTGIACFVS